MITYDVAWGEYLEFDFQVFHPITKLPVPISSDPQNSYCFIYETLAEAEAGVTPPEYGTVTLWDPDANGDILGLTVKITLSRDIIYYGFIEIDDGDPSIDWPQVEGFAVNVKQGVTFTRVAHAPTTEIEICNVALGLCGHKRAITSFTNATPEAAQCAILYTQVRDSLMSEVSWPFATRRIILPDSQAVTARSGWNYAYKVPVDFLTGKEIWSGTRNPTPSQRIPYAIEASDDASDIILLTDQLNPELIYTAKITDVMSWPSYFIDAVTSRLAMELVVPLDLSPQSARVLAEMAEFKLRRAIGIAFRHDQPGLAPESEFITVRTG